MTPQASNSNSAGLRPGVAPPGILVVDDDEALRTVLGRELRKRGFAVWLAPGGREAVALYPRVADYLDLVLMDLNMPGMNGRETFAALRAVAPDVRCCFMTAEHRIERLAALLADGAIEIYHKPFSSLSELSQSLREHARPGDAAASTNREAVQWTS